MPTIRMYNVVLLGTYIRENRHTLPTYPIRVLIQKEPVLVPVVELTPIPFHSAIVQRKFVLINF